MAVAWVQIFEQVFYKVLPGFWRVKKEISRRGQNMERKIIAQAFGENIFLLVIPFGWARNFIWEFNEKGSSFAKNKINGAAENSQASEEFMFHALLGNWTVLLEIESKDLSEFSNFLEDFSQRMERAPDPIF